MSKAKATAQVEACVVAGHAVPLQANPKGGFIVYEFRDGIYDGVKMRVYPPFADRITIGAETYVRSPPKNKRSARLTYKLEARLEE